jgi:hypothetical protein
MVMRAGRNVTVRGDVLSVAGIARRQRGDDVDHGVVVRNLRLFTQLPQTTVARRLITISVSSRSS